MPVLVTGGAGFIGPRIVRRLLDDDEQVVVYDAAPAAGALQRMLGSTLDAVPVVQGDVADLAGMMDAVQR